ncbi:TPA: hypothetical protein ACNV27_000722 [Citrobacter gillenii]
MTFASPANDYVERTLSPVTMFTTNESRIVETSSGFAVIEPVTRLVQGQVLLILSGGQTQFARFMGKSLITEDGEAIEGAAEEVEVMGRVTFFINSTDVNDESPV